MTRLQKKVAIVCFSNSRGGLELSTIRIAQAMVKKGVSVVVIVPKSSSVEQRANEANLCVITITPRWKYGDISAAFHLARVLKDQKIELVLLMQSKDIHLAAVASMITPQVKLVFYQQMNSRYNKRDFIHSWLYSKLSLWISLTQRMKEDVLSYTRVPRDKVKVLPLGTDLQQFNPSHYNKNEARTFFGLPQKGHTIGVLGRLDKLKGQHILIRAVPEVLKQHPNVMFLIAGDETAGEHGYKEYLLKLCRTLDIERYVRFLPFTDDVPRLMAALDVFVLPSFSETFGLVVVEAMAMQRPIIAANAGGLPEIITNGKTGILIKPHDATAVAWAIHRILGDSTLRSSLGHLAREEALKRFDFENCIDSLLGSLATL
jgi:glycosyltransferase involved in cell wall biosynthesis